MFGFIQISMLVNLFFCLKGFLVNVKRDRLRLPEDLLKEQRVRLPFLSIFPRQVTTSSLIIMFKSSQVLDYP